MRRFFQDYEMGGLDKLFQDIEKDESQIARENNRLYKMSEDTLPINDFDDDDLHIEGHQEEMKSSKWEQQQDGVKGAFLAHLKLHIERRTKAIEMQVEAARMEAANAAGVEHSQEMQQIALKNKPAEESETSGGSE
jgi:hypothetical protein